QPGPHSADDRKLRAGAGGAAGSRLHVHHAAPDRARHVRRRGVADRRYDTDPAAARHRPRVRSAVVRHHPRHEPGNRGGDAAGGPQPLHPARRLPVPVDRGDHPEFDPVRPHPGAGDDDLRAVPVAWTVAAQSAVLTAQPKEETMTRLTKRSFLGLALASGTLAINGMPLRIRTAHAAQTVTGVTYLTPTYQALMWGINGFVERLKEAGGDAITVEFYDSGS